MKFLRVALLLVSASVACLGQTAPEIAKTAFRSVVLVETNNSDGTVGQGSGFFVSQDVIATNAHVIKGAYSGTAKLIGRSKKLLITKTIAIDRHNDLALIKVDGIGAPLRLGARMPSVGEKVYVVGNPEGLEGTFSDGVISGIRTLKAVTRLQMTAPISPGSSGGPVMDAEGNVIGISVSFFREGQNLNFAVPVSYLSALLASSFDRTITQLGDQENGGGKHQPLVDSPPNVPKVGGTPKNLYALRYIDIEVGTGELAKARRFYTVRYTGWLTDGTKFDSSYDHPGGESIVFPYGARQVIPGLDTGFEGMHVGGKRRLFIPYQLAYGESGRPPLIPANADLIFDIEFVSQSETAPQGGIK